MKRISSVVVVAILSSWMICGTLRGAATADAPTTGKADPDEPTIAFPKGTRSFTLTGSYIQHIRYSIDQLESVEIAAGYYFWNNSSLNLELNGYHGDVDFDADVYIVGLSLVGRWHFLRGDKWTIFFDGGGGVNYADQEFPQYPVDGTNFNFTGKLGFGGTFQLRDNTHLIGGVRYFHLSNGQIRKHDDNPGYDAIQFWGGLMWTW